MPCVTELCTTALGEARFSCTPPTSDLCEISRERIFSTTGKPSFVDASRASLGRKPAARQTSASPTRQSRGPPPEVPPPPDPIADLKKRLRRIDQLWEVQRGRAAAVPDPRDKKGMDHITHSGDNLGPRLSDGWSSALARQVALREAMKDPKKKARSGGIQQREEWWLKKISARARIFFPGHLKLKS